MTDITPTRSVVLEMKEERRAMHDGYVFLDEKCLLLAGEMLRELERYHEHRRRFLAAWKSAIDALQAAVARHGLHGLLVYPAPECAARVAHASRGLMGVRLLEATLERDPSLAPRAVDPSQEADGCRAAFSTLLAAAAPLAASTGNLERLALEYRRSVRRARALQDVLVPEIDRDVADLEARFEELEQEDAIFMAWGRQP